MKTPSENNISVDGLRFPIKHKPIRAHVSYNDPPNTRGCAI